MANTPSFGLSAISQISVTTHDLERAVAFYRDRLGIRHLFSAPGMAFFDCDGVRLMLAVPTDEALDHPSSIIYFRVEDIQAAYEILRGRGVAFEGTPHVVARLPGRDVWLADFRDLDGNVLALMSEVPT